MWLTKLYTITKALTALVSLFTKAYDYYQERQLRKAEAHIRTKEKAAVVLSTKIETEAAKELPDDEAIKDLHRRLMRIAGQ